METILAIAQDTTTILTPLFLIICVVVMILVVKLLLTVNKTAGAVKETTFMVNNVLQSSFSSVLGMVVGLFDHKRK
jgi:hypothetical protein